MKLSNSEKGASVVEFALVLPLLLMFVFGIIEFGLILYDQAVLTNASRVGARYGIVAGSPKKTAEEIENEILDLFSPDKVRLISFASSPAPPQVVSQIPETITFGDNLEVRVNFNYDFLLVPSFIPGLPRTLLLEGKTVMKYE